MRVNSCTEGRGIKRRWVLLLKLIALGVIMFLSWMVPLALISETAQPAHDQTLAAKVLFGVSFLFALVLSYPIIRSRWTGLKLVAAVFFIFYGIMTVISQLETAYFIHQAQLLPPGMLPELFLTGAATALIWSPLAVLILGKWRREGIGNVVPQRLVMPPGEWFWKLAAIIAVYLVLYFSFGYYVAWQNPALRSYYGGTNPGSFLAQLKSVVYSTPGLILLQAARSLMWTAFALPVVRLMKGRWTEAGLAVSLLFAVLMGFQLLLPNPYMPYTVRMSHFVEVSSSNFLFGWFMVWLLGINKRIPDVQ